MSMSTDFGLEVGFSVGSWRKGNYGALGEKDFHCQGNKVLICWVFELLNHEMICVDWTRMVNKESLIQILQSSAIKVHKKWCLFLEYSYVVVVIVWGWSLKTMFQGSCE
jgi:hypothetical protein